MVSMWKIGCSECVMVSICENITVLVSACESVCVCVTVMCVCTHTSVYEAVAAGVHVGGRNVWP